MNKCQKCNVTIIDDSDRCPLCRHVLQQSETTGINCYPNAIQVTKRFRFLENLVLFLSLLTGCVLGGINYMVNPDVPWSLVVALILLYGNMVLKLAVTGQSGYMFKTVMLVVIAVVVLLGIDYLTGYSKWSLDYVLPIGILAMDLMLLILMLVNRRNWQSYMMTEILMILLSIIPEILLLTGVIHFPYLVWAAMGASVFLFLGTLILGDQRARTELKRRFHI